MVSTNNNYIIDTNILLRVLVNDVQIQYEDCVKLLQKVKENQITAFLPDIVITEVVWTLLSSYKLDKKDIVKAIESIYNLRGLEIINQYDYEKALKLFGTNKAKYANCLIASITQLQEKEWILISYDKEFDKLGVVRKEPSEIN